jgi:DNA adenine methylase
VTTPTPDPVKPAIAWPGGKRWAAKIILPLIPDHDCYCEPFAGGLAILCAKAPSSNEVVNDTHGDLVNFYRVVKYHRGELERELALELNSRKALADYREQPGLTDIQRAARWYRRMRISFGGMDRKGFAVSAGPTPGPASVAYAMRLLQPLSERLATVTIEHLDYARCLELYDRPRTFFFVDPPYTHCGDTVYGSWTVDQLAGLLARLRRLQGQWLLTINDRPEIRAMMDGWHVQPLARRRGINAQPGVPRQYGELLVSPRPFPTT